ncbi:hypothetical protein PQD09_gp71 [Providencia phage PSTCR4]|uniref:Uncharacterized protein n=1 Tax=Providencia phage PSTCR4 TaxID=2783546 RepID=A0A873WHJ8_9CAUD|nr:hypothetical protein PQD09_gp71 [Providencia phage PSTCR4]QPB12092.1 hypothetical protein [Providencia phage PSTCR4]
MVTVLGKFILQKMKELEQKQNDDIIINSLIALNDEQWDYILADQDSRCWAGGTYYGIVCTEYHIYHAYTDKYVFTGLREPLL